MIKKEIFYTWLFITITFSFLSLLKGQPFLAFIAPFISLLLFAVFVPIYVIYKLVTDETWHFVQLGKIGIIIGFISLLVELFIDTYWSVLNKFDVEGRTPYLFPLLIGFVITVVILDYHNKEISVRYVTYVSITTSGLMFSAEIFSFFRNFVFGEEVYLDIFLILFILLRYSIVLIGSFSTLLIFKTISSLHRKVAKSNI